MTTPLERYREKHGTASHEKKTKQGWKIEKLNRCPYCLMPYGENKQLHLKQHIVSGDKQMSFLESLS